MLEIHLPTPLADRVQEAAAARSVSADAYVNELVLEEVLHAELEKQNLRAMLSKSIAQADGGEGQEAEAIFNRILTSLG